MITKSKYTFLIKDKDKFLVYNSFKNDFWEVNRETFEFIRDLNISDNKAFNNAEEKALFDRLNSLSIVGSEQDDETRLDELRAKYLTASFSKERLLLTIAPTISCNLRCPYCFEGNKPSGIMDKATCDKLIEFIKYHKFAKSLQISWFGGEPTLCPQQIDYILDKILTEEGMPKLVYQDIVTNGTRLTGEVLELFEKYSFNMIQITLDGWRTSHDTKRVYPNGKGTFEEIMENLDFFMKKFPEVNISIRVNIDKVNKDDFMKIFHFFKENYPTKHNLSIYPGILKNCGSFNGGTKFLCNSEISEMYTNMAKEGIMVSYPKHHICGCGANHLSCYVIGPKGELYKCWQDVGIKDQEIGNIYEKNFSNQKILGRYLLHGANMTDTICLECPILPICDSNCANDRLMNLYHGADKELCCAYKENDYSLLKERLLGVYQQIQEQAKHTPS